MASAQVVGADTHDAVPTLTTRPANGDDERLAALRLVADSIAQQRQIASRAIITNPIVIASYLAILAVAARYLHALHGGGSSLSSWAVVAPSLGGMTMALLLLVRHAASGYLEAAEAISRTSIEGDQRRVTVTLFGGEVIGAAIWRCEGDEDDETQQRAVIWGWSVRLRYRGKGVGYALAESVAGEARAMGAHGIAFDGQHANSRRVLPGVFNGVFDDREARARQALQAAWEGIGAARPAATTSSVARSSTASSTAKRRP